MDSQQRVSDIAQVLGDIPHDDGFAVVLSTDHNGPTIMIYSTLDHALTVIDVTLADQPDGQDETREAEPELVRLGFTPITDESEENVVRYKLRFDPPPAPTMIADVCVEALLVLGSESADDLTITTQEIAGISGLQSLLSIQRAASWNRGPESTVSPPYVLFCCSFDGTRYEGFDHEADVVLGYLASLVESGLPGDLAREGLRAYRPLWEGLFAPEWEKAYPTGFPEVEMNPEYDLTLPCSSQFWWRAADLHLPGIGFGAGSPASGDFMIVADRERLDGLRRLTQDDYIVHEVIQSDYWGGPHGIPLDRIEEARNAGQLMS